MARSKKQGEKMREATREKILCAAVALFAEKGLAATSTQDIAKQAGVSIGLMYHYYRTKEDMFNALAALAIAEISTISSITPAEMVQEIVDEMHNSVEFAQWECLLSHSTDVDNQWIAQLSKFTSIERAQLFTATVQGLCRLQLTLKDDFIVPSETLLLSILLEDNPNAA